jgi:acetyl-CoA carboxylase/biotin carboxylase 1
MPSGFFSSQELIESEDGKLAPGSRPIGANKVGMVSWVTTMKTPEYPGGHEVVFIANDVTVQSGSFAVEEDEHYLKASQYAHECGLPCIYISMRGKGMENGGLNLTLSSKDRNALLKRCTRQCAQSF